MAKEEIKYIKTGIEWVPTIPFHWEMRRIKSLFSFRKEIVGEDSVDYKVLSLTVQGDGIIERDIDNGMGKFPATFDGYQKITPKTIVLCLFDMDVTPRIVGFSELTGMISAAYTNIVPKENVFPKFYYYYFLNQDRDKSLYALGKGIRITLREDSFGSLFAPYPSYEEQKTIVEYLDSQIEKINLFIAKKQRFIEFLKEQRQSVIDLAIANGTNPNVSLIESGVDWIGKFPQHWQFRKLKFCVSLNSNEIDESEISDEVFKIALENIDNWTGKFIDTGNPQFEGNGVPFKAGDVLFNKLRPYLAKAFIAKSSGFCVGELLVLSPNEVFFTSEFLFQRLMTSDFIDIVNSSTYGAKMPRASWNFIGNLKIPIPPIEEQKQIVAHIKTETATIDTAIAKAEREIELIREYKEAMISEAVMGKIL